MQPDEYRVCVAGGYTMRVRGAGYEAEAIVYLWGGRTVARFIAGGMLGAVKARAAVEARAQAWIAADDEARAAMQACEWRTTWVRGDFWRKWWAT